MSALFTDRPEAGRQLAARLRRLAGRTDVLVLGLPRGGVPVAAEVATALRAPLDAFIVRKLGVPGHEELAMGAVASGGLRVVNEGLVRAARVSRRDFDDATDRELHEVHRRERTYRMRRAFPEVRGRIVVLVDDGVATGSTMLAAVHALRQLGPAGVIAAAPVMSREAYQALRTEADSCEAVALPEPFLSVGAHYRDFAQTTDDEVRAALQRSASATENGRATHAAGS
jgi:putative phosphoribosyl transferase